MEDRQALRTKMRKRRDGMSEEEFLERNERLRSRLLEFSPLWSAKMVYLYISYRKEADTRWLLSELLRHKVSVAAPRVWGKEMDFFIIRGEEDLVDGYKMIPEPAVWCPPANEREALVLTPGLVFGRNGFRIGYGGGYYDRFFEREPNHLKIGLCYEFQIVDQVEGEAWERPLDGVLSETLELPKNSLS